MNNIPTPIFQKNLSKISWKKIYSREYGVQYSEMAILCLSPKAKYHIPLPSVDQIIIPEDNNTAFYIDNSSWIKLVESLNDNYTSHTKKLKNYEKQFIHDGQDYLKTSKKISKLNLRDLEKNKLKKLYLDYQEKLFKYSVFAWTSFILNNYISEKAKIILDNYIKINHKEKDSQNIYNSLFKPEKLAAILQLQSEVAKHNGKLSTHQLDNLYKRFMWLSCLDIHNKPWTKEEFKKHIKTFTNTQMGETIPFKKLAKELGIKKEDLDYLLMAKRFVYIKDARDDFRRQGVFYALTFFKEISKRMGIKLADISYLKQDEIISFLSGKLKISKKIISDRNKGFVSYLDKNGKFVCLSGDNIKKALTNFKILSIEEKTKDLTGTVASRGKVTGRVAIVKGVKDLVKVKNGDILVAVTMHPDFVPAMRRAVAIVTDEGGITSHAAIVSREFGIPCIVGTKNATDILKDGDRVEVDAIKGIIKINP